MTDTASQKGSIGVLGALSIGVGGIVGGGFFATFGLTIEGARGATPIAFAIGGAIALATAFSYIGLTLRYPGPGGTNGFLRIAYGRGLLPASMSVLLVLSYVAIMSVYASAMASYSTSYLPEGMRSFAQYAIASAGILILGFINFAGAGLMEKLETVFNIGKLGVLVFFILAGLLLGQLDWSRFEPINWAPISGVVATGMLGFLAYEGFELISNASADIDNPRRTLPIAILGSVIIAIVIYVLAFTVAIGHMSFDAVVASRDFAASAAAGTFLGPIGFAIMTIGAVFASASAINADYFGAAKLPPMLSKNDELPSVFQRTMRGQSVTSLLVIGLLALFAVNFIDLHALSAATSGGFLVVYAAVNIAAIRMRHETGTAPWLPAIAFLLCVVALVIMVVQFLSSPETVPSAIAVGAIVVVSIVIELVFRAIHGSPPSP
jgi:uncharacterized protein